MAGVLIYRRASGFSAGVSVLCLRVRLAGAFASRSASVFTAGVYAIALACLSCTIESPKAPTWDTTLRVPLTDHTYSIEEMIQGDEHLGAGADGLLAFHYEQGLDTSFVDDYLTFPEIHERISVGLDALSIPNIPVLADRFLWAQLTAEAISKDGSSGTIAPFSFNRVAGAFHASEDLVYAALTTGTAWLHVYNHLPVALENVIFSLQDPATSAIVVAAPMLRQLAAFDSALVEVAMAGVHIPPESRWLISGNSPGSHGTVIPIDAALSVDMVSELRSFSISQIEARIPPLTINHSESVVIDASGENAIADLKFRRGRFRLLLDNRTPFASPSVSLRFLEVKNSLTGFPLELSLALRPFSQQTVEVPLAAYTVHLDLPQTGSPQYFHLQMQAQTTDLRSQFITLGNENNMIVTVDMDDLVLDHYEGRLHARTVRLDSTVQNVKVTDEWGTLDGVTVNDARLQATLYHTIAMPIQFHGALFGFNDRGETAVFPIDVVLDPPAPGQEKATILPVYTSLNSSIVPFINLQPTRLAAGGAITIGDGRTIGHVSATDYVRGRFVLDIPVDLKWDARSIEGATEELRITPGHQDGEVFEQRDEVVILAGASTRHLRSVSVIAQIENHLPVGGSLFIFFGTDSSRLRTQPDVTFGPLRIEAAPVNAAGMVTAARTQRLGTSIPEEAMPLFHNDGPAEKTVYFSHVVKLDGTGGKKARLYLSDYVRVQALLEMSVRVENFDKDLP